MSEFEFAILSQHQVSDEILDSSEEVSRTMASHQQSILAENRELRKRLEEQQSIYRRKLAGFQENQQRQTQLVDKLQEKVVQYKEKCQDLEFKLQMLDNEAKTRRAECESNIAELESMTMRLEEEQQRATTLSTVNGMLRDQMDQAQVQNKFLASENAKLHDELVEIQHSCDRRAAQWQEDEASMNELISKQHDRLIGLWKEVSSVRRQVSELKVGLQDHVNEAKSEISQAMRSCSLAGEKLTNRLKGQIESLKHEVETEHADRMKLEQKVLDLTTELDAARLRFEDSASAHARELKDLNRQTESLQAELSDRDKALTCLQQLRTGQSRCATGLIVGSHEIRDPANRALVEEMQTLHLAIRDIAQMILNEDSIYADTNAPQVLDCPGAGECRRSRSRSPRYGSSPSPMRISRAGAYGRTRSPPPGGHTEGDVGSCYWGDSTLSAVYAALNRRSMQIAEASAKLQSAYSKLEEKDKQTADGEIERQALQNDILQLREEYSRLSQEKEKNQREADELRKSLDTMMQEKQRLERAKASLTENTNSLEADLTQVVAAKQELLDKKESLLSDLREARRDTERNARETERCKKCISSLEERLATCKEELAGANESLRLVRIEVESSRTEREELMKAAEKSARELLDAQAEIMKTRAELTDLSDRFFEERNKTEELLTKRSELIGQLKALEAELSGLLEDRHNLEKDRDGFRREVIRLQSEKNDLQGERTALRRALEMSEKTREATETELSQLSKANFGLTEQINMLTGQKNNLSQEMNHLQRETDRLRDALARVTREHAEVVREKGDLQAQVVTTERSLRQQADYIAALGQEKSQVERELHECRQELTANRQKQEALDHDLTEKERKLKSLTSDLTKVRADLQKQELQATQTKEQLTLQLQEREAELCKAMQTMREEAEREISDLRRSIAATRKEGERCLEEVNHTHAVEMDAQRQEFRAEREKLQVSVMGLQRERDELMLIMEGEKQKLITQADQERNLLIERMSDLEKHAQEAGAALADAKLEAKVNQQREEATVKELRKELEETRKQFSEERNNYENALEAARHDLTELKAKREQSVQMVADLTAKLKALEEVREEQRNELSSLKDRISEIIDQRDSLRHEFMETKKSLVDCQREKDSALETQKTLQIKLKELQAENLEINSALQGFRQRCSVLDEQKATHTKEIADLRANLKELEKARMEMKRECWDMKRDLKSISGERAKLSRSILELQDKLSASEELENRQRQDLFTLKQRTGELESQRESLKKALVNTEKRLNETQDLLSTREREHQAAVRQMAAEQSRIAECRSQLETALEAANEEARSLRATINSAEKRKSALEARLSSCEMEKRDVEMRLNSIHSSLRRIIGFRQETIIAGSRSRSPGHRSSSRGRSASPTRLPPAGEGVPAAAVQGSPLHAGAIASADLDPEAVRLGLRDFALRLAAAEHARDDANARVHSLEARLQEQAEQTEQWARRLHIVQQALCEVEEDKKGVDGRLASAQKALMLQEETLRKNERDRKLLAEKISQLERNLAGSESEKRQEQDMVTKLKQSEARQEEEKIQLRHALEDAENRINQLEVLRQSLEAEVQRYKCIAASREAESANIKEKNNVLTKKRQELDAKCSSLQLKIDQLSLAQSRTEEDAKGFKLKTDQLSMTILENNRALEEANERLRKTQKALAACEKEKHLLQDRLETIQASLAESRRESDRLLAQIHTMETELAETELQRAVLDGDAKQAAGLLSKHQEAVQELNKLLTTSQKEKQAMVEQMTALQKALTKADLEKQGLIRQSSKLEKDHQQLKRYLEKTEKEKQKVDAYLNRSTKDRNSTKAAIREIENENVELREQLQCAQAKLSELEKTYTQRMNQLTMQQRTDSGNEVDRLRQSLKQAERALEARERAHRQRVRGLEDQLALVRSQFSDDRRQRACTCADKSGTCSCTRRSTGDLGIDVPERMEYRNPAAVGRVGCLSSQALEDDAHRGGIVSRYGGSTPTSDRPPVMRHYTS